MNLQTLSKAKPILFNAEMTKAILDGRKVQTRRVVKDHEIIDTFLKNGGDKNKAEAIKRASKYQIDDILWVREPAEVIAFDSETRELCYRYKASEEIENGCTKETARIFLKITNVRVERLQDMEFTEIEKEGVLHTGLVDGMRKWETLWNSTAIKGYKWEDNPYVFVYDFEPRLLANFDPSFVPSL